MAGNGDRGWGQDAPPRHAAPRDSAPPRAADLRPPATAESTAADATHDPHPTPDTHGTHGTPDRATWPAPGPAEPWAPLGAVTVLIPAYEERATIVDVVAAVRRVDPAFGPLVVDDGSRDGTGQLALDAGARVLTHVRRRGNGAAIKSGLAAIDAEADVVVVLDADGQHDPAQIPRLLAALVAGADLAVASRRGFDGSGRARRWGNHLLAALGSFMTGTPVPDLTSGFRAFRVAAVRPLVPRLPEGFATPTTTTLGVLEAGRIVRFVPVAGRPRGGTGTTRTHFIQDGLAIALRATLRYRPWRAALALALVPVGLAVGMLFGLGILGTAVAALVVAPLLGLAAVLARGRQLLATHAAAARPAASDQGLSDR